MGLSIDAPSSGTALRLLITPPAGAAWWRVLRRSLKTIAGPDDIGAVVVSDCTIDECIIDAAGLINGTPYDYKVFYWTADGWMDAADVGTGTPEAKWSEGGVDPLAIIRQRMQDGLAAEIAAGRLVPSDGQIPVYTAPYWLADGFSPPMVTVHLVSSSPNAGRFLGNDIGAGHIDASGSYVEAQGWLESTQIEVVACSLNGDERLALRTAIARVLQANLLLFEQLGLSNIEVTRADSEDFKQQAPLFFTSATVSCVSLSCVMAPVENYTAVASASL